MAEIIIMPKLGFNMSVGKLVKWYKSEGEEIKKGDTFFSVETDKTNMDIEATGDGIIRKQFIGEGDTVDVTLPIAIVAEKNEDVEELIKEAMLQLGKVPDVENKVQEVKAAEISVGSTSEIQASSNDGNYDFDVTVIGGGPGGYVAAIKAAQLGKKTAIIEREHFGGVCLNKGCIPTKTLLRSVEALKEVKECSEFGVVNVDVSRVALDMEKVQNRKNSVVEQLVSGVKGLLKGNGVTAFHGQGNLIDRHTVVVDGKEITAENIIIATGSESKTLPIKIDSKMEVLTSTEALDLNSIPKSVVVIGGGVIGIEFAYFLSNLGTKVTVVEFLDRILPMVDEEITLQVENMLKEIGVTIHTGSKVTEITENAIFFEKNGKQEKVETEKVLMAVGRVPNWKGIDTQKLGIKTEKGAIVTDERLKTSVDNIYAIGDVNGKGMLAHVASMEGIVAAENICGHKSEMEYDKIPSAIYIQPEIASVGLTEAQAREKYGQVKVGKFPILANGKAKVAGEAKGLVKVIVEPRHHEIIGVHLYCIHATDMIAEAVVAMKLEGTAEEIAQSVHPHPTVSEVVHEAFHAALEKAIHFL